MISQGLLVMRREDFEIWKVTALVFVFSFSLAGCSDQPATESGPQTSLPDDLPPEFAEINQNIDKYSEEIDVEVKTLFERIDEQNTSQIFEEASPKFQKAVSVTEFEALIQRIYSRLGNLNSTELRNFNFAPHSEHRVHATIQYDAQFDKGSGSIILDYEKPEDDWMLLRFRINSPEMLDNPDEYQETIEVMVVNSDFVKPGDRVVVWDVSEKPHRKLFEELLVTYVRWRVDNPLVKPKSPVSGFVSFSLTKEQMAILQSASSVSVKFPDKAKVEEGELK